MARNRRTTPLEDIFEIASKLPWWVSTCLALLTYFVLHHFATKSVPPPASPGQLSGMLTGVLYQSAAALLYVIPPAFLAGALASFLCRRKRKALFENTAKDQSGKALQSMSWREFEMLVGEAFRLDGYTVTETGGGGPDGGIDLMLRREGEVFLVQCKQWRAYKVSVTVVRELFGVMAAQSATGGFVVTCGVFTAEAEEFAKGRNIRLIDGVLLGAMIRRAEAARPTSIQVTVAATQPVDAHTCPRCGSVMVRRTAQNGAYAGQEFWGCSTFPRCKGVIPIPSSRQ